MSMGGASGPGGAVGGTGGAAAPAGGGSFVTVGPTPQAPAPMPGYINLFAGRNDQAPATKIGDFECDVIENLLLGTTHPKARGGFAAVMDSLVTTTPYEAHGGHRVYSLGTTAYDYVAGTFNGVNNVRSNRSGAWSTIIAGYAGTGADLRVEFVAGNSAVYVFFGHATENPRKITGADSVANTAWAATVKPSMGVIHKKRLWVDDAGNVGRIWLSDSADFDTMRNQTSATIDTQGGYITLVFPDGDSVRGMISAGASLIVFSERSIHFITGSNFANITINSFVTGIGTRSPRSLVLCENDVWFLSTDGIVRFISSSQPNIQQSIVQGIPGWYVEPLTTALTATQQARVNAVYHDRRYWLFYDPSAGSALCWDFRELPVPGSRWTAHTNLKVGASWITGGFTDTVKVRFLQYDVARLREFPSGTTDAGTAIAVKWRSKAYFFGDARWEKSLGPIAATCFSYTGDVTVNTYEDLSTTAASTNTLTFTGGVFERQSTTTLPSTVQGRALQIELTASVSSGWELEGLEIEPARKRKAA